ncbi:glycogen debranching N-terminal domain-containing protein [Okibacterium endophyticum]
MTDASPHPAHEPEPTAAAQGPATEPAAAPAAAAAAHPVPLQPLLHDSVVVFRAPTQSWSAADGDMGTSSIHGVYHGDTRVLRAARLRVDGLVPEAISVSRGGASEATFVSLLRHLDDAGADPRVRLDRQRVVVDGSLSESLTVQSRVEHAIGATVTLELEPDFSSMHDVKAGLREPLGWRAEVAGEGVIVRAGEAVATVISNGDITIDDEVLRITWHLDVAPNGAATMTWGVAVDDPTLVVASALEPPEWVDFSPSGRDSRLNSWLELALDDLDALRLARPGHPHDEFLAAGAPWFLTLFGRDSLWSARFLLPLGTRIAASTLRVLARLQGESDDVASAEQPGKIMHELRSATLTIPGEGVALPPVYYGTVDATALWVCLLAEAWDHGMPEAEVRELLPTMRACLEWIMGPGDSDGDGFLDYVDLSGHGLSNQGWKDSGDSIQWRGGAIAEGPIALCEVQGYAYEAALAGARLLDHFDEGGDGPGAGELRSWAADLKRRFAEAYWVETPEGRYPAVALDADKKPVDSLTSNIGHLLGTGILEPHEEKQVASLLVSDSMSSGFGLRTMSAESAGYWPLSYHGGSVWAHDTAIVMLGMRKAGLHNEAAVLAEGLLAAAEAFQFRMPELHSGDARSRFLVPTPYPAACRPQGWSAAAAVAVLGTLG